MWTIAVILALLWVLGMLTSTTLGGLLHILLIIAIVVVFFNFLRGQRNVN